LELFSNPTISEENLGQILHKAISPDNLGRPATYGDRAYVTKLLNSEQTIYFIPMVCGGTGNCAWRIYAINPVKYLGEVSGQYFYTYQSSEGWPQIVTYTHMSAAEGILATYSFRNGKYKWLGDEYRIDYERLNGHRMPKFLEKDRRMCKGYGQ
jgi:hypothetical protein